MPEHRIIQYIVEGMLRITEPSIKCDAVHTTLYQRRTVDMIYRLQYYIGAVTHAFTRSLAPLFSSFDVPPETRPTTRRIDTLSEPVTCSSHDVIDGGSDDVTSAY